jgi:uncharacterized coiled-coil DUF342 family protein
MSDLVQRLENLKKEIDKTKSKTITLKANAEKEEEILKEIIKEIKDLGFNPKTLKEDIAKMEEDIKSQIEEKEKELLEVKNVVEGIERNVKSHEII